MKSYAVLLSDKPGCVENIQNNSDVDLVFLWFKCICRVVTGRN